MDEYISREAAIAKIREEGIYGSGYSDSEREENVIDMIESVPAADVRPVVHGKWTLVGHDHGIKVCECSACKKRAYGATNLCPNCGAEMEGN